MDKGKVIAFLVETGALRFGDFVLKAGDRSPFFVNLGDVCTGRQLRTIGRALAECVHEHFPGATILYGPPYKGISLASAAAMAWAELGLGDVGTLYGRKEAKGHGEKGSFVGRIPTAGDRIVIIDDVMSSGGTKLEAVDLLASTFGIQAEGILVTVDRTRRGWSLGRPGLAFESLLTLPDLVDYLKAAGDPHWTALRDFYEGEK
jgi:orotate phosphoribosyltransferase